MAKRTGKCRRCGHSLAYHHEENGELVCTQCEENDVMAPCAPSSS